MKNKFIVFLLFMLLSIPFTFAQYWNTGGNLITFGDFFGTTNNQAIFTQTNGSNRMKLNHNILYTVNAGTSVNRTGNLLIGRENNVMFQSYNMYNASRGEFSLLHLNGDGSEVQEFSYRNWMQFVS